MTNNFLLNSPELKHYLNHIVEHPGDALYNSFIISGDSFGGTLALEKLEKDLSAKYPSREILKYDGYRLIEFISKSSEELLKNFYKLHPNLLCVFVLNLELCNWQNKEQDKLALFLKTLIKQGIQVAVSTSFIYGHCSYRDSSEPTGEMWSFFKSSREYTLPFNRVIYTKDLTSCSLTLEQDKKRFKFLSHLIKSSYHFGELYRGVLSNDENTNFNSTMDVEVGLSWLGGFSVPCYIFPRAICPNCGKAKLIPYSCIASVLSGCHVIKFHCLNCKDRFATNQTLDYYKIMREYGTRPYYKKTFKK